MSALTQEELYRQLYEEAPLAQFAVGVDGHIHSCNQAAARLLGCSVEELAGRPLIDLYADFPAGKEAARRVFRRFLDGEVISDEELQMRRADGGSLWISLSVRPLHDADGRLIEGRSMIVDITRRKLAEKALRESEENYHDLFQSAYDVVFTADEEGNILDINRRGEDLTGYSRRDLLEMNLLQALVVPEDRPTIRKVLQDVSRGRERVYGVRWRARDGGIIHFEGATTSRWSVTGEFLSTRCTLRDLTERKQAEAAARRSEADYRALVEHATYGIYRSDPAGRFLTVNPALAEMLGYGSVQELLRVDTARDVYLDPGERARLIEQVQHAERIEPLELDWKRKDGQRITVRVSGRTLRTEEGELRGFEMIAEDITARRTLEMQLRQAQKMEAVGRLAGGIAHDFNNLLTAITGYSDLVLKDLDAANPSRGRILEIKRAAERAAGLTRQLLAFSRQQVLAPQILDSNELVVNMEKLLLRVIGENIEVRTVLAPNPGAVRADPGQLEQVIINLAVNARDAMPDGGRLTIETANVELDQAYARQHPPAAPGAYVMLSVSDSGMGMDEMTRARIFEPFFTTKEKGKGTGLGLATVYGIVKQSGGYVWVYSEPGHGTTFKVYLPRIEGKAAPLGKPQAVPGLLRGTDTVLLVEDDLAVRTVTRQILQRQGYTVLEAADVESAVAFTLNHEGPIDVLLTDVVMPGMNGRELGKRLTAQRPAMQVLYMSGYTEDTVVHHGLLEPGIAYLQKPFTPDSLALKLRELLKAAG